LTINLEAETPVAAIAPCVATRRLNDNFAVIRRQALYFDSKVKHRVWLVVAKPSESILLFRRKRRVRAGFEKLIFLAAKREQCIHIHTIFPVTQSVHSADAVSS